MLAFSLIKHTLLVLLGSVLHGDVQFGNTGTPWQSFFEAALFAWLTMLVATYVLAQLLYRNAAGAGCCRWLPCCGCARWWCVP